MEHYVFTTEQEANACLAYINGTPWFPIVGSVNGTPRPDCQKTERWMEAPRELVSGEWAVVRIPEARLDALNVPHTARAQFIQTFGQDIRVLEPVDFVVKATDDTLE
jgi:hypothetical protein